MTKYILEKQRVHQISEDKEAQKESTVCANFVLNSSMFAKTLTKLGLSTIIFIFIYIYWWFTRYQEVKEFQ